MTKPASGIRRFAELFLINSREYSSRNLMALQVIEHLVDAPHNGYFDETQKDDVIGVAGWIGTYEGWNALEDRWLNALPSEAKGDFHYTDFWARSKESYGQSWSDEKRLEHVKALARIARDCTSFAVGFVFSTSAYNEVIPRRDKKALKSPLHFCLAQCMVMLMDFYKTIPNPPLPPLNIMFDRKKEEQYSIGQVYYNVRELFDHDGVLGNMGFGDRPHMKALQAADLLVGEFRRNQAGYKSEVLDILKEKRPLLIAFPTDAEFRRYVQAILSQRIT